MCTAPKKRSGGDAKEPRSEAARRSGGHLMRTEYIQYADCFVNRVQRRFLYVTAIERIYSKFGVSMRKNEHMNVLLNSMNYLYH
jgi:hypothetical protein